ncbi:hypothetical protein D3C78_1551660 [compost metagenome]
MLLITIWDVSVLPIMILIRPVTIIHLELILLAIREESIEMMVLIFRKGIAAIMFMQLKMENGCSIL